MAISTTALVLGLLALLVMPIAGLGYRVGLLPLAAALVPGMLGGALLGAAAAVTALATLVQSRPGVPVATVGLLLGLAAVAIPVTWLRAALSVPSIHDITTDVANPPLFQAIVARRAGAPNALTYSKDVGRQQQDGYPGLGPALLAEPMAPAFARALRAARAAGWEIVDADEQAWRIEATDSTFWFGFKDDVVVRLTPEGASTRVDVRSVSRVGRSDIGTNARRIRTYLASLPTR